MPNDSAVCIKAQLLALSNVQNGLVRKFELPRQYIPRQYIPRQYIPRQYIPRQYIPRQYKL